MVKEKAPFRPSCQLDASGVNLAGGPATSAVGYLSLRLKHTSKLQKIVKGTAEGGFSREKVLWKLDFPEKIHMLFSSALVGGGSFYGVEVIPSIYSRKPNQFNSL